MSGRARSWFWTLERLEKLRQLLNRIAERDELGLYLGSTRLGNYVLRIGASEGLTLTVSLAEKGLALFVFLEILEPSDGGIKLPGYKRRYYPDRLDAITPEDIDRFRRHVAPRRQSTRVPNSRKLMTAQNPKEMMLQQVLAVLRGMVDRSTPRGFVGGREVGYIVPLSSGGWSLGDEVYERLPKDIRPVKLGTVTNYLKILVARGHLQPSSTFRRARRWVTMGDVSEPRKD